MPLGGLTSFHSTAKIAPRMHQRSSFWAQKSKNFLGRGHSPLPRSLPQWGRGYPLPTPYPLGTFGASILAPMALETRAFGARHSRLAAPPSAFPVLPPDLRVLAETLKRGREGGEGEREEGGGKGRRRKGRGGKGRAPMTLWHGAPNVLIRSCIRTFDWY